MSKIAEVLGREILDSRGNPTVEVDVRLDEVVLHALEKEPERRYQHASEVKTDVETIVTTAAPGSSGREFAPFFSKSERTHVRCHQVLAAAA